MWTKKNCKKPDLFSENLHGYSQVLYFVDARISPTFQLFDKKLPRKKANSI